MPAKHSFVILVYIRGLVLHYGLKNFEVLDR